MIKPDSYILNYKKIAAFTLIELLVVLSVISLLASIILSSLNTAREKGQRAAILMNLDTIHKDSALYHFKQGNYGSETPWFSASEEVCDQLSNFFGSSAITQRALISVESLADANALCVIGPQGQSWAMSMEIGDSGGICTADNGGYIEGGGVFASLTSPDSVGCGI